MQSAQPQARLSVKVHAESTPRRRLCDTLSSVAGYAIRNRAFCVCPIKRLAHWEGSPLRPGARALPPPGGPLVFSGLPRPPWPRRRPHAWWVWNFAASPGRPQDAALRHARGPARGRRAGHRSRLDGDHGPRPIADPARRVTSIPTGRPTSPPRTDYLAARWRRPGCANAFGSSRSRAAAGAASPRRGASRSPGCSSTPRPGNERRGHAWPSCLRLEPLPWSGGAWVRPARLTTATHRTSRAWAEAVLEPGHRGRGHRARILLLSYTEVEMSTTGTPGFRHPRSPACWPPARRGTRTALASARSRRSSSAPDVLRRALYVPQEIVPTKHVWVEDPRSAGRILRRFRKNPRGPKGSTVVLLRPRRSAPLRPTQRGRAESLSRESIARPVPALTLKAAT